MQTRGRDSGAEPIALKARLSVVLKALNHPTRRGILRLLREGPQSVTEIAKAMRRPENSISTHLGALLGVGAVLYEKAKKNSVYRLAPGVVVNADGELWHISVTSAERVVTRLSFPLDKEELDSDQVQGSMKLHGRVRRIEL